MVLPIINIVFAALVIFIAYSAGDLATGLGSGCPPDTSSREPPRAFVPGGS